MKARWIFLTALLGGTVGLAQQVPLSWFAGETLTLADPNARALGTVWDGHVAFIEGLPPIATQLEGRKIVLAADGAQLKMTGVAEPGRLSDIALNVPIRSLARFDPRLAGLVGNIDLRIDELLIVENRCTEASGSAMTDVLSRNAATWQWAGPELQGPIRCEDGAVVITMEGADASGNVDVRIAISPTGPYRTDVSIYTPDPNAAAILPLFGFERGAADTYRLSESGAWQ